jgi:hypothetical protein
MSNKKLKKGKGGLAVVHFDFESLSEKHIVKTGKPLSKGEFAKITGGSYELLPNWRKELPHALSIINHFMKEYDMDFEELVKEVHE